MKIQTRKDQQGQRSLVIRWGEGTIADPKTVISRRGLRLTLRHHGGPVIRPLLKLHAAYTVTALAGVLAHGVMALTLGVLRPAWHVGIWNSRWAMSWSGRWYIPVLPGIEPLMTLHDQVTFALPTGEEVSHG